MDLRRSARAGDATRASPSSTAAVASQRLAPETRKRRHSHTWSQWTQIEWLRVFSSRISAGFSPAQADAPTRHHSTKRYAPPWQSDTEESPSETQDPASRLRRMRLNSGSTGARSRASRRPPAVTQDSIKRLVGILHRFSAHPIGTTDLRLSILQTHRHSPAAADPHAASDDEVLTGSATGISGHSESGNSFGPSPGDPFSSRYKCHTFGDLGTTTCG